MIFGKIINIIATRVIYRFGFCRWCRFTCRTTWTPRTCTWNDDIL